MSRRLYPFDIDSALDTIDLRFKNYTPTEDAVTFFNIARLIMGKDFAITNPKFHYFLVDVLYGNITREQFHYSEDIIEKLTVDPTNIAVIASRGSAKSTITTLFYPIVAAIKGTLPVTGELSHILILSDSAQGGAKDQALIMGNTVNRSAFCNEVFEKIRFTQTEVELIRKGPEPLEERHMLIKFKGAQMLREDELLYGEYSKVKMKDVKIGDKLYGPDGKLAEITEKSDLMYKAGYKIVLQDGRELVVSIDHINSILYRSVIDDECVYEEIDIVTSDMLKLPMFDGDTPRLWVKNTAPVQYPELDIPLDDELAEEAYLRGSIDQRLELLKDFIGTEVDGDTEYIAENERQAEYVAELVRSLGGTAKTSTDDWIVYIKLNTVGSDKVAIIGIEPVGMLHGYCIAINNNDRQYLANNYFRTHNTGGIRSGSRNPITGDRYGLILADDVIKNEAESYSDIIMHNVNTALNSDALNAMRAGNTQYILVNTPFHKKDPVYMAMESGAFTPVLAPICESINESTTKENFVGVWESNHSYDKVMQRYLKAAAMDTGIRSFNQELLLRISNDDDKLIPTSLYTWFPLGLVLQNLDYYNIIITTDFTSSNEKKGDFSGIFVWAVNSKKQHYLIDLTLDKLRITEQYDIVYDYINKYSKKNGLAVDVGVEVNGNQRVHIEALREHLLKRGTSCRFPTNEGNTKYGAEGIDSKQAGPDKHARFRMMVPYFEERRILFPKELKTNKSMVELLKQIGYTNQSKFASADDGPDCISMLRPMKIYYPMEDAPTSYDEKSTEIPEAQSFYGQNSSIIGIQDTYPSSTNLSRYLD
jgi:hypothetical protein